MKILIENHCRRNVTARSRAVSIIPEAHSSYNQIKNVRIKCMKHETSFEFKFMNKYSKDLCNREIVLSFHGMYPLILTSKHFWSVQRNYREEKKGPHDPSSYSMLKFTALFNEDLRGGGA